MRKLVYALVVAVVLSFGAVQTASADWADCYFYGICDYQDGDWGW